MRGNQIGMYCICESCETTFRVCYSRAVLREPRFCSHRCQGDVMVGLKSAAWRGRPAIDGNYRSHQGKMLHIQAAEKAYGGPLPPEAVVHHVDEDGANFRNDNLLICPDRAYHNLIHARLDVVKLGGDPNVVKWCGTCKGLVLRTLFYSCKDSGDGLRSECKPCGLKRGAQWSRAKRRRMKFVDATKLDANNPRAEIELRELAPQ